MTNKYDLESLRKINESFHKEHGLTRSDVDMANEYVELIERTRSKTDPKAGDIIRYTNRHGRYYHRAHIESNRNSACEICLHPYIPFIFNDGNSGIICSTSGGPWTSVPAEKMKYAGTDEKLFKDWGHCGPCGNGSVSFHAIVSVWEYAEPDLLY